VKYTGALDLPKIEHARERHADGHIRRRRLAEAVRGAVQVVAGRRLRHSNPRTIIIWRRRGRGSVDGYHQPVTDGPSRRRTKRCVLFASNDKHSTDAQVDRRIAPGTVTVPAPRPWSCARPSTVDQSSHIRSQSLAFNNSTVL
jgi:hypothetical protein